MTPNPADIPEEKLIHLMKIADPFAWAKFSNLIIDGQPFTRDGHEYQADLLAAGVQDDIKRQCFKKAAQLGGTVRSMLKTLHGLIYGKYPQGAMYIFPTDTAVRNFSQARFTPLIEDNPSIQKYIASTDNLELKRVGKSKLYFRGATVKQKIQGSKKSSISLKSDPVDKITFDESDEMDSAMINLALFRMSHSNVQEEEYLSTPTIPDFGIDKMFTESDQRVWEIKCGKCGKYTCLEREFPESLVRTNGTVKRVCVHCRDREIHPRDGQWVAQYPDRSPVNRDDDSMVGWWISQLNSTYIKPKTILDEFEDPPDGNTQEVYNSRLGVAYIPAENRLEINQVYTCCGQDHMMPKHVGPCAAGVDVGSKSPHRVVIGVKIGKDAGKIVRIARVKTFEELHELFIKYGVKCCVIDLKPEQHKVRELQASETFPVFACDSMAHQRGAPVWNAKEKTVVGNKTEMCDATCKMVTELGRLSIPKINEEVKRYAVEMCNTAKVSQEDSKGNIEFHYVKVGDKNDHYFHATNYFRLAIQRISTAAYGGSSQQFTVEPSGYVW